MENLQQLPLFISSKTSAFPDLIKAAAIQELVVLTDHLQKGVGTEIADGEYHTVVAAAGMDQIKDTGLACLGRIDE